MSLMLVSHLAKGQGGLSAHYIWLNDTLVKGESHAAFRKTFYLHRAGKLAVLGLFAYTRYELYVNGRYICRGPSRFENKGPEFDRIEISRYLKKGKNLLAVLVHRDRPNGRIMAHEPGLAVRLQVNDRPKTRFIYSDTSWKAVRDTAYGAQKRSWSSISENIDASKFDSGWVGVGFDDHQWPKARLIITDNKNNWPEPRLRSIPLLKESIFKPLYVDSLFKLSAGDSTTLNFSRLLQAYPLIRLTANSGASIEIKYQLPDGSLTGINHYICSTGIQDYRGGDTYAFNSLKIKVLKGNVQFMSVKAVEVLYPFNQLGQFYCSDTLLNNIWKLSARTLKILSEDAYVDCADRERVEWIDCDPPAFNATRVMMAGPGKKPVWSDARLLRAMLRRVAFTQQYNGMLKAHTASERWDKHAIMEDRTCVWVNDLRKYYDSTDDKHLVDELWPILQKLLNWFTIRANSDGLVEAREWATIDNPLAYQSCEGATLDALLYSAYSDAAYLAKLTGHFKDEKVYQNLAEQLYNQFNKILWNEDEGMYNGGYFTRVTEHPSIKGQFWEPTLEAGIFALNANIVPSERIGRVYDWVQKHLSQSTAPMSQNALYKVLYRINKPANDEAVLSMIRQHWQAMALSSWQTGWEDFKRGSKVHVYGMVPAYYLSSYVLGVRLKGNARNKTLIINPRLGELTHAGGIVVTEFGPVRINWQKKVNNQLIFDIKLPKSVLALVNLPKAYKGKLLLNGKQQHVNIGHAYQFQIHQGANHGVITQR